MKRLIFFGSSRNDIKAFPKAVRVDVGQELTLIQHGYAPTDFKPMPSVGRSVLEIRIKSGMQYRVIYLATRPEGVHVLHAFQKKSQKTAKKDIDLARRRFKEIGR